MNKVFAMLPCYNESENIDPLVRKWLGQKTVLAERGYTLLVRCIDDKSKDNTKEVIEQLCKEFPNDVALIAHEVNKGLGGALNTAFSRFLEEGKTGDVCVLMDGDNTHDPVFIDSMIEKISEGFDCVIASRYCEKSKTKGVSGIRQFLSWGAKQFYTLMLHVRNVQDYTCGYRAYTYALIERGKQKYAEKLVEKRSFACMMEVLYKLWMIGANFAEVPFELRYDIKLGESKMRVLQTVKESFGTAFRLRRSLGKRKK
jgi:dolichol-phosphate mannosyltransferase